MFGRSRTPRVPAYVPSAAIVSIAGDGLIGTHGVGDGRMIPVVILDTSNRADIEEYIRVHSGGPPGDVRVQWAHVPQRDTVILKLSVARPLVIEILIGFRLPENQGILVEQILSVSGLYIQAGRPGDRLKSTLGSNRIIVEVPDTGFRPTWDKIFLKHTTAVLREHGLTRSRAKVAARDAIQLMRQTGEFRFPSAEVSG
jgi:hypothetical protein